MRGEGSGVAGLGNGLSGDEYGGAAAVLDNAAARRMMGYISPIYANARRFMSLMNAIGSEMDGLSVWARSLKAQAMPQTADWALPLWELEYSIRGSNSDADSRRALLLSRIRTRTAANPWAIAQRASAAVGWPVDVIENAGRNRFLIYVRHCTADEPALCAAVDEIKPAHLVYSIKCGESAPIHARAACHARYARRFMLEQA